MALIYVVEDDNDILEIETFALKNSNYEVKGFSNAKDFYEAIEEKVPSLAVLDVMLPDEDGLQIVQKVRSIPKMANLPIIMVTARTTEIDKVKGLDIGADDYLTKPFGVMELIARVKALLRRTGVQEDKKQLKLEEIIMDDEKHAVFVNEKQCELTYKEYEFLKMLLENIGIVLKRESIMGEAGNHIKTVRNVGYMIE